VQLGGIAVATQERLDGLQHEQVGALRRIGFIVGQRLGALEALAGLGVVTAPEQHRGLAGGGEEVIRLALEHEVELLERLVELFKLFVGLGEVVAVAAGIRSLDAFGADGEQFGVAFGLDLHHGEQFPRGIAGNISAHH